MDIEEESGSKFAVNSLSHSNKVNISEKTSSNAMYDSQHSLATMKTEKVANSAI